MTRARKTLLGFLLLAAAVATSGLTSISPYVSNVVNNNAALTQGTVATANYVNAGFGATFAVTPKTTGNVHVSIGGFGSNSSASDGVRVELVWGTGAVPPAGTNPCQGTILAGPVGLLGVGSSTNTAFQLSGIATGLTVGTSIWVDVCFQAVTGGTATIGGAYFNANEL